MSREYERNKLEIEDCADIGGTATAEVEKAYRRGFAQGAHVVIICLQNDVFSNDLFAWIDVVDEWRGQGAEWKPGEQVRVVDPLNPVLVRVPMQEALSAWKQRM